jgi:hypothetical protein
MEELLIKKKHTDMMAYAYQAMTHFPKSERFALCVDIKRSMARALELITRASLTRDRLSLLRELDVELKVLLEFVRLAHVLKFLSTPKYEFWSKLIVELGRMCGGLIKNARTDPKAQRGCTDIGRSLVCRFSAALGTIQQRPGWARSI